jgi:hypothetical protein
MMRSVLEQYRVADFLQWHAENRLILNPDFQRRSVWTDDGKSYLIDTLLGGLPMPKIYMRTIIDVDTQTSIRDIVDGQQRMRAIIEFSRNELRLTKRAAGYSGSKYADLDNDTKEGFLSYAISVEQLVNATDDDVLEVFARLNSYTVPLNAAELRHATYQGDFKWKVRELSATLAGFWKEYGILSTRDRLRMLDDQFTAELCGILLDGVRDGGKVYVNGLYERYDSDLPRSEDLAKNVRRTIGFATANFDDALRGEVFSRSPQFLILFATLAHALNGIPKGDIGTDFPKRRPGKLDVELFARNLAVLTNAIAANFKLNRYRPFIEASRASTQRISSRKVRFLYLWRALKEEL